MNGVIEALCRIYVNRPDMAPGRREELMVMLRRYLDGRPLTANNLRLIDREIRALKSMGVEDAFSGLRDQLRVAENVLHEEGAKLREELLRRIEITGIQLDRPGVIIVRVAADTSAVLGKAIAASVRQALDERGAPNTVVFIIDTDEEIRHLDYAVEAALCVVCQSLLLRRPDVLPLVKHCRKCSAIELDA